MPEQGSCSGTLKQGCRETALGYWSRWTVPSQVLMIFRPAGRFLTIPFPPDPLAARFFAAVILPPLLFFAIVNAFRCCVLMFILARHVTAGTRAALWGVTLPWMIESATW